MRQRVVGVRDGGEADAEIDKVEEREDEREPSQACKIMELAVVRSRRAPPLSCLGKQGETHGTQRLGSCVLTKSSSL